MIAGAHALESPFWAALDDGDVCLPRCSGCARWQWPPEPRCADCGSFDHEWRAVEPVGEVYSWTRVHRASSPRQADLVPYVVVLVALRDADQHRLLGRLVGPEADLTTGAAVRGRVAAPSESSNGLASLVWELTGPVTR